MAGLGLILGGALGGVGEGMMKAQIVKDQERRDAALSALRRGERKEEQDRAEQIDIRNDDRMSTAKIAELNTAGAIRAEEAAAARRAKGEDAKTDYDRKLQIAKVESALRKDEAAYQNYLDIIKAEKGEKPVATGVDANGDIVTVWENGRTQTFTGVKPTPRGSNRSDDGEATPRDRLGEATSRAGKPTQTAKPANRPALSTFQK